MTFKHGKNRFSESDQRYLPRWEVENRILFKQESRREFWEGYTKDLSCAGACINVNQRIKPSDKIKLTIFMSEIAFVNVTGTVVWIKSLGDRQLAGVSFYNTPTETQDVILEYAFNLDKDKFLNHVFKGW